MFCKTEAQILWVAMIGEEDTAVLALETADLPLTQNNICAEIGMVRTELTQYKRAKTAVEQVAVPYH